METNFSTTVEGKYAFCFFHDWYDTAASCSISAGHRFFFVASRWVDDME